MIDALEGSEEWPSSGVDLEIRKPAAFRMTDPTVVVAMVSGTATVLSSLITGLLAFESKREDRKVVIKDADGNSIEVPGQATVEEAVDALQKMKSPKISMS